ncbi:copper amine oxidase [Sporodiniella umbellata]|nr:copper amine oxidase [Sporodiniella umbellata]
MNSSQKPHPLDPLTSDEISKASAIVSEAKPNLDIIFHAITLKEPEKTQMLSYLGWDTAISSNSSIEREAFVIAVIRKTSEYFEATVSLTEEKLTSWKHVADAQAPLDSDTCKEIETIVREDEQVRKECLDLGITDISMISADVWPIGRHLKYPDRKRRLFQCFLYLNTTTCDNQYAHPIDFVPVIVLVIDHAKSRNSRYLRPEVPRAEHGFFPKFLEKKGYRKDVKPISIQQPQGASFTVRGNEIDWQKWNMHISMNHREGLVIHNVSYQDGIEKRPLFYRISLSEMFIPYADPVFPYNRKQAFDVGECGLGICTNSLKLGCDCLGSIHYFDAVFNDNQGEPVKVPNAICLHEEDNGILFKHTNPRTEESVSVRSQRLVISHISTIYNYDYGFYYYFYQDGSFQYEVKATGQLSTTVLAKDEIPEGYGTTVAPQVNAPHHQHFFTMRIDPMIDGINNSVASVDVHVDPLATGHPNNQFGNGFKPKTTILRDTIEGQQCVDYNTGRFWKILNENRLHPYTRRPVGWKIYSKNNIPLFAQNDSIAAERAGFTKKNLYVTPYNANQQFAGGRYANMSSGKDTLEHWAKSGHDIVNRDIVLWFTFGLTHLTRVEDFPCMPVETCGFSMKPFDFFTSNPGLDVPPTNVTINHSVRLNGDESSNSCCANDN